MSPCKTALTAVLVCLPVLVAPAAADIQQDVDLDGIEDAWDNCPLIFNPDQMDANENGFGDPCDSELAQTSLSEAPSFPSPSGSDCVAPPSCMVSWWPLDEGVGVTTADLVGQNDGRLGREPTDPVWSAGFVGNALRFDGVDDVVRHTGDPSLDIAEAITLDAWIFPTATKSQTIVRRSAFPFSSYSLALSRGRHVVFSLPISGSPPVDVRITGYAINTWTHVAGTYDGTSMKLYVNGELVNSAPRSGPLLTTPTGGNLLIGTRLSLPSGTFQGLIDEVESFDRALSETEIRSIFNAGPHGKCKARLLVQIDVKPDSDENPINSLSHGVIAVAILASESFDTADIDVTTLAFGPDGATPAHQSGHFEDVNGDGLVDLVSHYATGETGIAFGDTQACATGMLLDGTRFQGCTPVHAF